MMSFHTSRKALSWSAAGKVCFFPVLMKTGHLVSLCTIWLKETENNAPPCRPSSGLCTGGGDPCRDCCPFSFPKVLPKKTQCCRRKKASVQRLLKREQSGMTESRVQGKFSPWQKPILISVQADAVTGFWLVGFTSQIVDFPMGNSESHPHASRVREMSFGGGKNISAYWLSFHVKRSKSVCSWQRVYSRHHTNHGVPAALGLPHKRTIIVIIIGIRRHWWWWWNAFSLEEERASEREM